MTCGYLGGWAASLRATADLCAGTLQRNMQDAATMVLVFSLVAAVAVLVSAANLTVVAQRRSYALWQLANVGPRRVGVVVLAQLAVVAVVGAVVGTLLSAATFVPLFSLVFGGHGKFSQVAPQVGASSMPAVWLAVAGVFLCGGLKGARGAAKTPPLTALREPEPERRGMTWLRALLFVALAACAWWVSSLMLDDGPDKVLNWSLYIPLLMVAAMVPLAPLAFSAFLSAWTSLLPQKWNALVPGAAHRSPRPFLQHLGRDAHHGGRRLVAGVFSIVACAAAYAEAQGAADFAGLDFTTTILMLGGPVLLCAVGAAVSVVMTSRSRTRDVALFVAAGARPATLLAEAACEACIHAVTATLVGVAVVVVSNAVVAYAYGLPLFTGLSFGEGLVVSLVGFALVLVATLVPTCTALRQETAAVLSAQE